VALTGAAFVDADVLFPAYWSPAVALARSLVDEQTNCEDILMNFVAGNMTLQVSAPFAMAGLLQTVCNDARVTVAPSTVTSTAEPSTVTSHVNGAQSRRHECF
jgi:hypothetical protein